LRLRSSRRAPVLSNTAVLATVGPARRRKEASFTGPVIEARGVTKSFGGIIANKNINFSVEQGELRGIIGPNGAGKSTFFKMLTCERHHTWGQFIFDSRDITGLDIA